ncbi:O-antigen ligase family protein, partial [Candidatus Gottesmanbacteria bacterium]|nr:O-antigen ligase family protein [Candidatus Gottesmanbacteria bacterium]
MREKLFQFSQRIIEYSFYLLFFLVPLILTPFNYELFEYNKMMLTYGLTIIISGIWLIKMIIGKEFRIARTPLDLPIILFLASQIISTAFSLDRHVSVWGYYSRFNGGLLSIITYILLYYAFVSNFPKEKTGKLLQAILISGAIVALYGILEHFGIDKDLWVQDVQNRVFSSLGQPNWLAAYLAVLIPTTIGLTLNSKFEYLNPKQYHNSDLENSGLFSVSDFGFLISKNIGLLVYWVIGNIFYITLLFTKSRSGFLALWISLIIFWLISLFLRFFSKIRALKSPQMQATASICGECNRLIGFFTLGFLAITFFLGAPFQQVSRFTLPELISNRQSLPATQLPTKPLGSSIIDVGITESGTIRRIVWKGAVDVFSHYPIFGSGVETFAFAYYKFRPSEHNMTSEWDFLYNKAHNEYLNFAATTGVFGIGSYLLIVITYIIWFIWKIAKSEGGARWTISNNIPNPKSQLGQLEI